MNLALLSDEELKQFITKVFGQYDRNHNGVLQAPEIALFFTHLYRALGYNVSITLPVAQQVIKDIRDISHHGAGGTVTPYEVYLAFKVMSNQTAKYFQYFSPILPPANTNPKNQGMDVEDCQQWAWPDK